VWYCAGWHCCGGDTLRGNGAAAVVERVLSWEGEMGGACGMDGG